MRRPRTVQNRSHRLSTRARTNLSANPLLGRPVLQQTTHRVGLRSDHRAARNLAQIVSKFSRVCVGLIVHHLI